MSSQAGQVEDSARPGYLHRLLNAQQPGIWRVENCGTISVSTAHAEIRRSPPGGPQLHGKLKLAFNLVIQTRNIYANSSTSHNLAVFDTSAPFSLAQESSFGTLYSFSGQPDEHPQTGVAIGKKGVLYGTKLLFKQRPTLGP